MSTGVPTVTDPFPTRARSTARATRRTRGAAVRLGAPDGVQVCAFSDERDDDGAAFDDAAHATVRAAPRGARSGR